MDSFGLSQQSMLEDLVLSFMERRGPVKSACPSEIAREWARLQGQPDEWRGCMEVVRQAAFRLPQIAITQKGRPVVPGTTRGPIRLVWRPQIEGSQSQTGGLESLERPNA